MVMKEIKSKAIITNGILKIIRRKEWDSFIQSAKNGDYQLILKKLYRKRSVNENAFYWGPFLDEEMNAFYDAGWHFDNKDVLHEWNKNQFLTDKIVNEDTGEVMTIVLPSSGLETVPWELWIEKIRQHFREFFNAELPYPNDNE
jgi:hypothetical protein